MSRTRRQARTLRSTRPAARIAADRARRPRGGERSDRGERTAPKSAARTSAAKKSASRGGGRGKGGSKPPKRRLVVVIAAMAALGFASVYIADGISSALAHGKLGDYTGAELWDKLVDRLLDRDVPRTTRDEPVERPKKRPAPKPSAPEKTEKPEPPEPPKVARADLEAESPEAYARESRSLDEAREARRAADESRKRIDAILRKVGVPER